jgi:hypothetical protein
MSIGVFALPVVQRPILGAIRIRDAMRHELPTRYLSK